MTTHPAQEQAIRFTVHGIPKGAGSKGPIRLGNGNVFMKDSSDEKGEVWTQLVNSAARAAYQGEPLSGPVSITAHFRFPHPKAHYRGGRFRDELRPGAPEYVDRCPDLDKLLRRLYDALTGVVWVDDKQVVMALHTKMYHARPGAYVEIVPLSPAPLVSGGNGT